MGVLSGLSERPDLNGYKATWQSPVHCRERLRITGRDGSDSPKTRRGRRLWREGLSGQIAYADCSDNIDCISQTALVTVFSKGTFPEVCEC